MSPQSPKGRSEFLKETTEILRDSAPAFNYNSIGKIGLQRGLMNRTEVEALALRGSFPAWLAEGLASPATRLECQATVLITGCSAALAAPTSTNDPASPRLESFVAGSMAVPPVHKTRVAGQTRHYLHNFRKLVWGRDGVYSNLSDTNGIVLHPFLERVVPVKLPGHTLMAVVEGSAVYTHWLLDTFPRFLALIEAGTNIAEFDHIVLATAAHSFHRRMLARLGLDPKRVITRQKDGPYFETASFVHVSAPRMNFAANPRMYEMVCEHFGQPRAPKGQTRRLFVSRAGAGRRRILNEEALAEILEPEGFEIIRFEDYGMEEMAALMAQASHVVAPHGAGLANLVFCRSGTRVMEVFGAHLSREYWIIAQQRGLSYYAFQANGPSGRRVGEDERKTMSFFDLNGLDIQVPISEFREYLTGIFFA